MSVKAQRYGNLVGVARASLGMVNARVEKVYFQDLNGNLWHGERDDLYGAYIPSQRERMYFLYVMWVRDDFETFLTRNTLEWVDDCPFKPEKRAEIAPGVMQHIVLGEELLKEGHIEFHLGPPGNNLHEDFKKMGTEQLSGYTGVDTELLRKGVKVKGATVTTVPGSTVNQGKINGEVSCISFAPIDETIDHEKRMRSLKDLYDKDVTTQLQASAAMLGLKPDLVIIDEAPAYCECGVDACGGGLHSHWCPKA